MAGGKKKTGKSKAQPINLYTLQTQNNVQTSLTIASDNPFGDEFGYEEKIEIKVPTLSRSQRVNYDASRCPDVGPFEIKMEPVPYGRLEI